MNACRQNVNKYISFRKSQSPEAETLREQKCEEEHFVQKVAES